MHTHSRTLWHMYTHPNTAQITGYNAYLGFLYLDYTYNNAVVHTFVNLLSGYKTKPVSMLSFDNLQKDHSLGKLSLCAVWDSEVLWLRRACMPICLSKSSNLDILTPLIYDFNLQVLITTRRAISRLTSLPCTQALVCRILSMLHKKRC